MSGRSPADAPAPLIEVMVRKDGKAFRKLRVGAGRLTFGRDESAGVQLDSRQVSRIHFELDVAPGRVIVKDAGSRNGIRVGGRATDQAELPPRLIVSVPGFEIAYRWLTDGAKETPRRAERPRPAPLEHEVSAGWEEYLVDPEEGDDDADEEEEALEAREGTRRTSPPMVQPMAEEASEGSVLNRLVFRRDTGGLGAFVAAGDPSADEEELLRPPLPPLVLSLHEEANALLYGPGDGRMAVEVIETLGDQVHRMALLFPGQRYWWGAPLGIAALWRAPDAGAFPAITYTREGEYHVEVPDDGRWKLFHRGEVPLDVYKRGAFLAGDAEWEDQVELGFGPFSIYVRCVRAPVMERARLDWRRWIPTRRALGALLAATVLHGVALALPAPDTHMDLSPWLEAPQEFVEVTLEMAEARPEPPEPEPPPPERPPREPVPSEPPRPQRPPPRRLPLEPVAASPAPQRDALSKRSRRSRPAPGSEDRDRDRGDRAEPRAPAEAPRERAQAEPPRAEEVVTPAPAPPASTIGVEDFKVYGMIGHLPELSLAEKRASSGGRRILHGGKASAIATKAPNLMGITPDGSLTNEQVSVVVNSHHREVMRCFEKVAEADPSAQGRLELAWVVEADGKVGRVRVLRDTVGLATLVQCVRGAIQKWVFPRPNGGAAVVTYPFRFQRI